MGRQGLNRPPQLRVAKGNTKCQSHQPQYVRAPAKRSSAKSALVQAVLAPLPHPGSAGTIPGRILPGGRAWGRAGPGTAARWEPGRRDDALSGTRGRWSHRSVKCQDAGGRPEGTLPGHCHHLIPGMSVRGSDQHFGGAQQCQGCGSARLEHRELLAAGIQDEEPLLPPAQPCLPGGCIQPWHGKDIHPPAPTGCESAVLSQGHRVQPYSCHFPPFPCPIPGTLGS